MFQVALSCRDIFKSKKSGDFSVIVEKSTFADPAPRRHTHNSASSPDKFLLMRQISKAASLSIALLKTP